VSQLKFKDFNNNDTYQILCIIQTVYLLGYGLEDRDSRLRFLAGTRSISLHHRVQTGSEAHPAFYPMVTGTLSLRVKGPGREADHSSPSSA